MCRQHYTCSLGHTLPSGSVNVTLGHAGSAELFMYSRAIFLIQLEISSVRCPHIHLMFEYVDLIGRIIRPRADTPTYADVVINVCSVASIYAEVL